MSNGSPRWVRALWHAHALFWGKNETETSTNRNTFVLVPHPDDETIGMGATLARKAALGTRVILAVATDGVLSHGPHLISPEELIILRKTELREAAKRLGISKNDIYFFDETDTHIDAVLLEKKCNELIDSLDVDIDEIMTTSIHDFHIDHQICGRIGRSIAHARSLTFRACPIYWWAQGPVRSHRGHRHRLRQHLGSIKDLFMVTFSRGYVVSAEGHTVTRSHALDAYVSQTQRKDENPEWDILDPQWLRSFERKKEFFTTR